MTNEEFWNLESGDHVIINGNTKNKGKLALVRAIYSKEQTGVTVSLLTEPHELIRYNYKTLKLVPRQEPEDIIEVEEESMDEDIKPPTFLEKALINTFNKLSKDELINLAVTLMVEGISRFGRKKG